MTEAQIEAFFQKRGVIEHNRFLAKKMLSDASDDDLANNLSCDHKHFNGVMAGPKFEGLYCGFRCEICGCSVSYESMGY